MSHACKSQDSGKFRVKRHSSLVICFCNGGEKIWDIARKYNTTVEDIMSENELTSDEIGEKMMLMIPVK